MANQLKMAMVHAVLTLKQLGWSQRRTAQVLRTDLASLLRSSPFARLEWSKTEAAAQLHHTTTTAVLPVPPLRSSRDFLRILDFHPA